MSSNAIVEKVAMLKIHQAMYCGVDIGVSAYLELLSLRPKYFAALRDAGPFAVPPAVSRKDIALSRGKPFSS